MSDRIAMSEEERVLNYITVVSQALLKVLNLNFVRKVSLYQLIVDERAHTEHLR